MKPTSPINTLNCHLTIPNCFSPPHPFQTSQPPVSPPTLRVTEDKKKKKEEGGRRRDRRRRKMKWGRKHLKENKKEEAKKKSSFSMFSFSRVLPLFWISKLTRASTKTTTQAGMPNPTTKAKPNWNFSPPRSAFAHVSSTPDIFDRIAARCPPEHPDVPRRLSIGDDETSLARARAGTVRTVSRSSRHNSIGEFELRPVRSLQLAEPPPRLSRAWPSLLELETEQSDLDPSSARRRPPPRRRRRQRRNIKTNSEASEETDTSPPRLSTARKSFRIRTKPRYKVFSPRLASVRKRSEEEQEEEREVAKGLERFAVVKKTCDPQREFRESMVEMIGEEGIVRPEELESLLACYLALNSDEHHDVIVKVFRQVWFDLDRRRLDPKCPSCRRPGQYRTVNEI